MKKPVKRKLKALLRPESPPSLGVLVFIVISVLASKAAADIVRPQAEFYNTLVAAGVFMVFVVLYKIWKGSRMQDENDSS